MGLASATLQADSADMLPMFMPAELEPISRDTATTEITEIRDNNVKRRLVLKCGEIGQHQTSREAATEITKYNINKVSQTSFCSVEM